MKITVNQLKQLIKEEIENTEMTNDNSSEDSKKVLEQINQYLNMQLTMTIAGDEIKGYVPDTDEGGVVKTYLNKSDCLDLARLFSTAAKFLK